MTDKINGAHRELIKLTARETVRETLKGLGADADDPIEMQRDFQHLRDSRKGVENTRKIIKRSAIATVMTVALPAALYVLWEAFRAGLPK